MPPSQTCTDFSASLQRLYTLKQSFEVAFENTILGNTATKQEAQRCKEILEIEMAKLRAEVSAWRKTFVETHTPELFLSLFQKKLNALLGEKSRLPLNKYELLVLYEIYTSDSLPGDLLDWRKSLNPEEDLLTMFDPEQIARSPEDVSSLTQIYIGPIDIGLFQRLPDSCTSVYESFPERKTLFHTQIGGKDESELQEVLNKNGDRFYDVTWMLEHDDFKRPLREPDPNQPDDWTQWKLKSPEELTLVRIRVANLGFSNGATIEQIFARAEELGLELCPPEVGPQFRLQYKNQPMNEHIFIGMKPIWFSGNDSYVFRVSRDRDGSWLDSGWAWQTYVWSADFEFVFRLRKSSHRILAEDGKALES